MSQNKLTTALFLSPLWLGHPVYLLIEIFTFQVLEGVYIYKSIKSLKLKTIGFKTVYLYILGYGVPILVTVGTTSAIFFGQEVLSSLTNQIQVVIVCPKMYLRRDSRCQMVACFLVTEAMVAMIIPAIIVAVVNTAFTLIMAWTIHQHRKKRNR